MEPGPNKVKSILWNTKVVHVMTHPKPLPSAYQEKHIDDLVHIETRCLPDHLPCLLEDLHENPKDHTYGPIHHLQMGNHWPNWWNNLYKRLNYLMLRTLLREMINNSTIKTCPKHSNLMRRFGWPRMDTLSWRPWLDTPQWLSAALFMEITIPKSTLFWDP